VTAWQDSPNGPQTAVRRLIGSRPAAWVLARTFHHIDKAVFRISGGRTTAAAFFTGLPIVTLTTTGARSGEPRTVPLVGILDGGRLLLVASNWGQARHPAWYHNLVANPTATIPRRDVPAERLNSMEHLKYPEQQIVFRARELAGEEREAAWAQVVKLYPWYAGYAMRAGREIPLMALETA
jgi:deazaflavin-dependent oxidoreductase (nitroreductase family)